MLWRSPTVHLDAASRSEPRPAFVDGGVSVSAEDLVVRLPAISTVRAWSIVLAAADAIMCEDPLWRYFAFERSWRGGGELASMSDGSGNDYWIVFRPAGVYIRGFDHESPLSPFARDPLGLFPGLVDEVPDRLRSVLDDPACQEHGVPLVTVSMWRLASQDRWQCGTAREVSAESLVGWADPDGSNALFAQLDSEPESYARFAEEYYEREVDRDALAQVFAQRPPARDLIDALNPGRYGAALLKELAEIGYVSETPNDG